MTYAIVDDGQTRWVAERDALVAAIASLGWEDVRLFGRRGYREPDVPDDTDPRDQPYVRLCAMVGLSGIDAAGDMPALSWFPAESVWLWDCHH